MRRIPASIRHNLAGLLRFSGRDTRGEFWPYAIVLFLLSAAAGMMIAGFLMADMLGRVQRYLIAHPEGLPPPVPGQAAALPPELMPDMSAMAAPAAAMNIVLVLLLAAAVVRRLHDRDRTGLWGLLPVPFMIVGMINRDAGIAMAGGHPLSPAQSLMLMATPLFWLALIVLIVMLAGDGTKGANRFGPAR